MTLSEETGKVEAAAARFAACIASLPEELFLAPIDAWTPRDVLAHLIGWNRLTVEGATLLMQGELPPYFADVGDDFAAVNAVSVRTYASRDRGELLAELDTSLEELRRFLGKLSPAEWEVGVPYGRYRITVGNSVQGLTNDYVLHREQIERWLHDECGAE